MSNGNFARVNMASTGEKLTYIGTANLGVAYGLGSQSKVFPKGEISDLLKEIAKDERVLIDTA